MKKEEIWKPVFGAETSYEVSDLGRIRSLDREVPSRPGVTQKLKGIILRPKKIHSGYLTITLTHEGRKIRGSVHRRVAETFIPNPENKATVNHKNLDKTDNRVVNLEWNTMAENRKHAIDLGVDFRRSGIPVIQKTKEGEFVARHNSVAEAAKSLGVTKSNLVKVCRGKRPYASGYIWEYAD